MVYEFGQFRLDPQRRVLTSVDGRAVHLTAKPFDALVYLVEHAGALVTRAELTDALWPSTIVEENNLSQAVSALRKALGNGYIATVARRGYQFTADVRAVSAAAPEPVLVEPAGLEDSETTSAASQQPVPATSVPLAKRRGRLQTAWVAGAVAAVAAAAVLWAVQRDELGVAALDRYSFTKLTEFEGAEEQPAISRDGRYVAFLRERDGLWGAWIGAIGTGDFRLLTDSAMRELRNPAVRTLSFSPDNSRVLIWTKTFGDPEGVVDGGWAAPVVGSGLVRSFRAIAELDWSPDGRRIAYHTAEAGDPLFVAGADEPADARRLFVAPDGVHAHFPLWSPDAAFIYFVMGIVPNEMDLYRIPVAGGEPDRLTFHNSRVAYPTVLDARTLLYLASAEDGSGPWLHALDVERRTTRRMNTNGQPYTALAASADGARLVATVVQSTGTLWRVPVGGAPPGAAQAARLPLDVPRASAPQLGPGFVVYRAPRAGADGIFTLAAGQATEIWNGGRVLAGPSLAPDGRSIAFVAQRSGRAQLHTMSVDGSAVQTLAAELDIRGAPAWSPDGRWLAIAALRDGAPRLYKVSTAGGPPAALGDEYAIDPAWSPDGAFIVFSGADIGTNFELSAVSADGASYPMPALILSRGSRRLDFLADGRLVVLKGDLSYKDFWAVDLATGAQQQLTALGAGPAIGDFDVAPDGSEIVFDRLREESDIMLIERDAAAR